MKILLSYLILIFVTGWLPVPAQIIEIREGSLVPLKGTPQLNIEYDFSKLQVSGFATIEEYIAYKRAQQIKYSKGDPAAGDLWYNGWINSREEGFGSQFEKGLNKKADKCAIEGGRKLATKYTLIVQVRHYNEPTFTMSTPAGASCEAKLFLVETADRNNRIAEIRADYYENMLLMGNAFGTMICKEFKR